MKRFTTVGNTVYVMLPGAGYGNRYSLQLAKRVPRQVREALRSAVGLGPHEVLWDRSNGTATMVSVWDRIIQW